MKLNMDGYEHLIAQGPFLAANDVPSFAGISGGRTSAKMAALLAAIVWLCFQNTGREDYRTIEFLKRLQDALQREITLLEWRPAPRLGDPPRMFSFEVVTFDTLTKKSNTLIAELMRYLNAYRKEIGKDPLVPWARSRLCTAYLKHRTMEKWIRSLGVVTERGGTGALEWYVGLRADEPDRVAKLHDQQRGARSYRTPLDAAGITKADVNRFWSRQPFDLELPDDSYGNCDGCFLKDEADVSRALGRDLAVGDDWVALETEFPGFGRPRGRASYAELRHEYITRTRIEETLRHGFAPDDDGRLEPKRFRLVVKQEEKRLREGSSAFSCACEQTIALADGEDDADEDAAA